jgi:hypothetical protein
MIQGWGLGGGTGRRTGRLIQRQRVKIPDVKTLVRPYRFKSCPEHIKITTMPDFTNEQILLWKEKAEKWDALRDEISKYYSENDDEDKDEDFDDSMGLIGIGEKAAVAFGFL